MNKRQKKKRAAAAAGAAERSEGVKEKIGLPKITPKIHTPPRIMRPIKGPGGKTKTGQ